MNIRRSLLGMSGGTARSARKSRPGRRRGLGCLVGLALVAGAAWTTYGGGRYQEPGTVTGQPVDPAPRDARQAPVAPPDARRILFGDLHVHTTYSADAFMRSLPLMGGEGLHPPADACDFARYCSGLDFFALTDHAEALTPRHWRDAQASIRQCNAVAGDPANPDLVAFMGFEWSQVGTTPETHWGHKNVIFRDVEEDRLPARPIGAAGPVERALNQATDRQWVFPLIPILEFPDRQRYLDAWHFLSANRALPFCEEGVDSRELPVECRELAATPRDLFDKLDQWGFDALVIPHGTTWGFYTPPGYLWDKQVDPANDDPARQRLVEIYSGHGNSEELRSWRAGHLQGGEAVCPSPTEGYEPCCWRAGEIIRGRCEGSGGDDCEARAAEAREAYVRAGVAGHLTVPGAEVEEWGECGQCTDCFNPAFAYRPGGSAQYALARGHFEEGAPPRHPRLGFIASSDNHSARPGTGYKEYARRRMTETSGFVSPAWRDRIFGPPAEAAPRARAFAEEELLAMPGFRVVHLERQASFFMTGGLVAVHADGRDREAIWEALEARRVYGTSGERILLWFTLEGAAGAVDMGDEAALGEAPRFRVRAAGAFEQLPGCPGDPAGVLGAERFEHLCAGECHHPGDRRRRITRVEVVRVRLQQREDEPVETLVDDPWRTLPCPENREGARVCEVRFEDPEFVAGARDVAYYVRAIQEPSPAVNAGGLRCDEHGRCEPCYGDWRTPADEDCLSENEERAWSSPIWVRFDEAAARAAAGEARSEAGGGVTGGDTGSGDTGSGEAGDGNTDGDDASGGDTSDSGGNGPGGADERAEASP